MLVKKNKDVRVTILTSEKSNISKIDVEKFNKEFSDKFINFAMIWRRFLNPVRYVRKNIIKQIQYDYFSTQLRKFIAQVSAP